MKRNLTDWLALGFSSCLGAGYLPGAPGTYGSALALPLAWALDRLGGSFALAAGAVLATVLGTWAAQRTEQIYQQHDSSRIVVDELAGQLLTCLAVPRVLPNLVLAFVWFRLCDIVKPWPACWADKRVNGGIGVMLDDVFAALYAAAASAILVYSGLWPAAMRRLFALAS